MGELTGAQLRPCGKANRGENGGNLAISRTSIALGLIGRDPEILRNGQLIEDFGGSASSRRGPLSPARRFSRSLLACQRA